MAILSNEDLEYIPLRQLGWTVWPIMQDQTGTAEVFIRELRNLLYNERGVPASAEGIFRLVKKVYPDVKGIDIYDVPPGICLGSQAFTMPAHYHIRAIGGAIFDFALIAKDFQIKPNNHVYYMGKSSYYGYAKKFIEVTEETILDITKDKSSLTTVGAFMRGNRGWLPLPPEDNDLLTY